MQFVHLCVCVCVHNRLNVQVCVGECVCLSALFVCCVCARDVSVCAHVLICVLK